METANFSLLHIIGQVYRWRKALAYFVGSATVLTALISLLLSDYYTASAIFAPANDEKELFGLNTNAKNNSLYGDDDAIDRALIFAESANLVDYMVEEFKLAERYDLDASTPKGQDKIRRAFRKLYKVKKSELNGIKISIQDTDPQVAADMLQKALDKIGALYKEATQPNRNLLNQTYEAALQAKQEELKFITDTLSSLRRLYGVYNVDRQGEMLSKLLLDAETQLVADEAQIGVYESIGRRDSVALLRARIQGNRRRIQSLRGELEDNSGINVKSFNKGADLVLYYESLLETINKNIDEISTKYIQFKAQSNSEASSIIVLEPVQVPRVKTYPVRSLFVAGALVLSLILGIIAILLLDTYRHIPWREVFSDDENTPPTPPAVQG